VALGVRRRADRAQHDEASCEQGQAREEGHTCIAAPDLAQEDDAPLEHARRDIAPLIVTMVVAITRRDLSLTPW
jgi:hypothetical protein